MNSLDIKNAKIARKNAHSIYSNFQVGAVLRCKNGNTYTGCNVENHGLQSICAERTAFVKAISEGERDFESIAVVGGLKDATILDECMPCGYCRQFMSEFVDNSFKIITEKKDEIHEYTIQDLLPFSFDIVT